MSEDNSPEALQASLVDELLDDVVFRTIVWCRSELATEREADVIAGKALVKATAEWLMRLGEKPPVGTPSPP